MTVENQTGDLSSEPRGKPHAASRLPDQDRNDLWALGGALSVKEADSGRDNALPRLLADLQASRQKFLEPYDFAPAAYLLLDRQGSIVTVNYLASDWLGLSRGELQGKRFQNFIAPQFQDQFLRHYHDVLYSARGRASAKLLLAGKKTLTVRIDSEANIPDEGCCRTVLTEIPSDHPFA